MAHVPRTIRLWSTGVLAAGLLTAVPAAVAAVAAPTLATAVVAAPTGFAPAHHAPADSRPGYHVNGYNINGYNWGGYAATGSGFTSVEATWVEPSVTCNSSRDLFAPWVGIDGYNSSTVEQTGVATDCSSGRPAYQAWYEMYPASPVYLPTGSYPVSAGDTIRANITYAGSSKYTLTIRNTSRSWTYTITKTLRSAVRTSAEVIIESPTGAYPNFGAVTF